MAEQMARQQAAGEEARARVQHLEEQRGKLLAVKVEYKETARRLRAESIRLISEARVKGDHAMRLQGWLKLTADGAETARGEAAALRGGLARMQACLGAVREECAGVDSCVSDSYSGSGGDDDGSKGWAKGASEPQALSGGSCGATTTASSSGAVTPANGCVDAAGSRSVDDAHPACADVPEAAGVLMPDATAADGAGRAGALAALDVADDTQACASPSGGACEVTAAAVCRTCSDASCGVLEAAAAPAAASIAAGALQQLYAASEEQVQADGGSCSESEHGQDDDASAAGRSDCSVVVIVRVGSPCGLKAGAAAAAIVEGCDCSGADDAAERAAGSTRGATAVNAGGEGLAPGAGVGARPAWWGRLRGKACQAKAALRCGVLAPLCFTGAEADRF
ncbi:hypothetical protein MNEG_12353 [Monoraphidium neglectum]|uniref:Uncharacterized protein n=1 Tax=Monoraphidium neglectum TaxID=145388 RepID=A0A0D2LVS5_9CHLO|nr:hypothetical protein MNEG_12353 [Monoraphidium neglectum]KIY95609.1 hypothetical protein MNEG_12353 [Monoraphidium neglectum]|eukprot:XP_013894629.1 hypothetical protein MNEG_12353 [Monoraphidium neglectum]